MIDLHAHSTFSDGSLTPEELVALAVETGLTAVALTDHDCTDGVPRFLAACEAAGITGVAGVEISAEVPHGALHMLGYGIEPGHPALEPNLANIRDGRQYRNTRILARLNELGLPLTWDEVAANAGEDVVGRPHFAKALLDRGYVSDKQAAFDRYLGKGASAYVDRFRLSPADSLAAIRAAGGVPVLAHPFTLDLGRRELAAYVAELKTIGLGGIEVYYSEHSAEQVQQYLDLAVELDLVATGGTDFHGEINPDVKLGTGFGNLRVPDDVLAALEAHRHSVSAAS
jgi:predicted metal-dependent phosphoesterase TrpH